MDLNTYMHIVDQMRRYQPAWRLGQTFSNVLHEYRPDLAKKMIGGNYDPFYQDEKIPAFISWLRRHWNDVA